MWKNPQATAHFRRLRYKADKANRKEREVFFDIMRKIGDEMDAASRGALSLPRSNARVLDLCMAPGGYTAAVLKHSPHAAVCAYTLPQDLGGHPIIHCRDSRVGVMFGDITLLHTEFGVEEVPREHSECAEFSDKRPWFGKRFDLVFCDGQALRTHKPHIADYQQKEVEAARLTVSQLILAMQRIESGGTLIMLLHNCATYKTIKILRVFDDIAQLQVFKPTSCHTRRGSFYLIAKNVQPGHPEAVAAVDEWKKAWKQLSFPTLAQDGKEVSPKFVSEPGFPQDVSDLLETFGERVIELGEPIWQIQKEALATANWGKKQKGKVGSKSIMNDEAPAAATDHAAVAVHDSEDDAGNTGAPDDVDTTPVLGEESRPTAKNPADEAKVSVAMERLGINN